MWLSPLEFFTIHVNMKYSVVEHLIKTQYDHPGHDYDYIKMIMIVHT